MNPRKILTDKPLGAPVRKFEDTFSGAQVAVALVMAPEEEENAVRQLGELIGYGRVIQIAQRLREARDGAA